MVNYMFKVDSSKQGLEGGDIIHNRVFAGLVHILNVSVVVRSPERISLPNYRAYP